MTFMWNMGIHFVPAQAMEMLCHAGVGISQPSCPPCQFQMQTLLEHWPPVQVTFPAGSQPRCCQSVTSVLAVEQEICNVSLIPTLINRLQCDHHPMHPAASLVWSASSKMDYLFLHGFTSAVPSRRSRGIFPISKTWPDVHPPWS